MILPLILLKIKGTMFKIYASFHHGTRYILQILFKATTRRKMPVNYITSYFLIIFVVYKSSIVVKEYFKIRSYLLLLHILPEIVLGNYTIY